MKNSKLKQEKIEFLTLFIWLLVVIFLIGICTLLSGCSANTTDVIKSTSKSQITAIDASYATLAKECKTDAVNQQYKLLKEQVKTQENVCLQAVDAEKSNTQSWILKFWLAIAGIVMIGYLYIRKVLR